MSVRGENMAKRNMDWSDNKLQRFLDEGRGTGEGKEYKPWLVIQDMPSKGRVSRIFCHKTQRIHHLFTDNETRMFYIFMWEDAVTDIRENFPLFNMEDIIIDKTGIDFSKFADKKTGTPYIFTTTFLITYKNKENKDCYIARSIKSSDELEKKYIIEKFEVERRYWESKGVDWGLITQKDIPVTKAKNIEWVYSTIPDEEMSQDEKHELSQLLLQNLIQSTANVRTITSAFDKNYNLDIGTGLFLFKYLIATKEIIVNMDEKINVNIPVNEVILEVPRGKESGIFANAIDA